MTLHLLDKYTKNPVMIQPSSEGVAFSQKGDRNKKNYEHYAKVDMERREVLKLC